MRESVIEKYLVKRCKEEGWLCYKFSSPAQRGVPDRIVCMPRGTVVFVEVKQENGVLSKLQEVCHEELLKLGQFVTVVWSKEDVDHFIKHWKANIAWYQLSEEELHND